MRRKKKGSWDQWQQPWSGYREPKTGVGKTQLEKHEERRLESMQMEFLCATNKSCALSNVL